MLRAIVILLVLANAAYFAWTQGWLAFAGLQPSATQASQGTPAAAPINSNELKLLSPEELAQQAAQSSTQTRSSPTLPAQLPPAPGQELADAGMPAAPEPAPPALVCMMVGTFTQEQFGPLQAALQTWPADAWSVEESTLPGRWMVFWGNFDDELVYAAKRSELENRQLAYDPVRNSPQGTGFSLGRFSTEAAANQETRRLTQRGLTGLTVVKERDDALAFSIRFPDYEPLQARIRSELLPLFAGKTPRNCS